MESTAIEQAINDQMTRDNRITALEVTVQRLQKQLDELAQLLVDIDMNGTKGGH